MKKDITCAWISFICIIFFWVPIVNLVLLPLSIYFSIRQIKLVKKDGSKYGGYLFCLVMVIFSILCLLFTALIFYLIYYYQIKLY